MSTEDQVDDFVVNDMKDILDLWCQAVIYCFDLKAVSSENDSIFTLWDYF